MATDAACVVFIGKFVKFWGTPRFLVSISELENNTAAEIFSTRVNNCNVTYVQTMAPPAVSRSQYVI